MAENPNFTYASNTVQGRPYSVDTLVAEGSPYLVDNPNAVTTALLNRYIQREIIDTAPEPWLAALKYVFQNTPKDSPSLEYTWYEQGLGIAPVIALTTAAVQAAGAPGTVQTHTFTTTVATQGTTQDFTAPISQVLASKPDAVAILLVGPANPTAMKQLRQAGYTGDVLGNSGASAGNLKPAGADGAGMVWPTDFNYQQKAPSSQKFVTLYQASNPGENPLNYAAEAYDAAWFLAKSIKAAGNADRAAIKTAMGTVSGQSFDGALGTGLTWKDREIVVPGVMIRYDGTNEVLLYEGSGS